MKYNGSIFITLHVVQGKYPYLRFLSRKIFLQLVDYGEYIFVCFYPSTVQLDSPENSLILLLTRDKDIFTWPHVVHEYLGFLGNTHDLGPFDNFSIQIFAEVRFPQLVNTMNMYLDLVSLVYCNYIPLNIFEET